MVEFMFIELRQALNSILGVAASYKQKLLVEGMGKFSL